MNSEVNLNTVIRLSLTFGLTLVKKEADAVMSAEVSNQLSYLFLKPVI